MRQGRLTHLELAAPRLRCSSGPRCRTTLRSAPSASSACKSGLRHDHADLPRIVFVTAVDDCGSCRLSAGR
eukprot:12914059-Prorocentrum_lima.AAC.1